MTTTDLTLDKNKGDSVLCLCRDCRKTTKHIVINEATVKGSEGPEEYAIDWSIEHQVVRCLGCDCVSFRRVSGSSEDYVQTGDNEWDYQALIEIFPNPGEGRQALADVDLLPDNIQRIYKESIAALNSTQPVLCGIGVRAIVETVCKDKGAPGAVLSDKINGLVGMGVLTGDGAQILHKLRTLGNMSAHEVKPHSLQELGLAFDVIDHLLLGVYILPIHAKKTFK